ncbi:MAG TPA: tetratricopeptide repeat protein [Chthoniobacterales bacterium]|nr:tetratricopeptide repeat protein [Chthoniobacterales bacterium]
MEPMPDLKFEIGHVLFIDIVGYSKLNIHEQSEQLETLKQIVRGTEQFRAAEAEGKLLRLPTGDGGALVFRNTPEAPALCAVEISKVLKSHPELKVRMGIHSGPVNEISDLNEQSNIAGAGINMAQRVMDCGDAGHILLSKHVADDLEHYPRWQPFLHSLGECEVKHGARIGVVSLHTNEVGNPKTPKKMQAAQQHKARTRWAAIVTALLLLSASVAALMIVSKKSSTSTSLVPEKSIAVLPFENLSSDKENAYFAEGIQDEILTRLSKIAVLKVISRTSTQKYKSAPDNLHEVGQQLGVANLLEGSVQKAGNAVHINVQLIKAATDAHLWAESYDRKLDDVFGVEGEVATAIADQLNARLSQSEQKAVTAKPTQNTGAYDAYLRGLALQGRVDDLRTNWVKSAEAFAEAVRLDPDFAVGWAQLSRQESLVYNSVNHSPDHQAAARTALDNAMKLGPDLVETKIAQGWYQSYVEADYDGARVSLEQVRRQYPNNSTVSELLAAVLRRQGHWEESRRLFDQTVELDPRNVFLLANAALAGLETRDPAYTQEYMRRALDLSPQNATLVAQLAASYQMSGDIKQAQTVLDSVQPRDGDSFYFSILAYNAIYLRNYPPAIGTLQLHLKNLQVSDSYFPNYENYLADLQRHSGDIAAATTSYRKAKADAEKLLHSQPDNADLLDTLAWSETWLGDKSAALKHAQEAVVLMPASKEPRIGPGYEDTLARIQAQVGEKDAAITALQHLLVTSYSSPVVTPALLRLDPDWDNLRGDPRFQKLCQEPSK